MRIPPIILGVLLATAPPVVTCERTVHAANPPATPSESTPPVEDARLTAQVFHAALEAIRPAIVRIETVGGASPVQTAEDAAGETHAAPAFRQADGPTTGVIWTSDGNILTSSFNFVRDPLVITVQLSDGRRFVAKLLARDRIARLALLKIDATSLPTPRLASRNDLEPGDWLLTAGFGQGGDTPTISTGVLSGRGRMSGLALQTDAKTSPANYGGPTFDIDGRLAGICVPIGPGNDELAGVEWYDSGIGFAITIEQLTRRFERLRGGEDVERGLMGVTFDPSTPTVPMVVLTTQPASRPTSGPATEASSRPTGRPVLVESSPCGGLLISETSKGPAAGAGLQAGDCIVELDGETVRNLLEFRREIINKAAGDRVEVGYVRDGARRTVTLVLVTAKEIGN